MNEQQHTPEPVWSHPQNWIGVDGAVAYHLIDSHAEDWLQIGQMMDEWLAANSCAHERDAFKDAAEYNKRRAEDAEKQRDELLAALEFQFALSIGLLHAHTDEEIPESIKESALNLICDLPGDISVLEGIERSASVIASVKGSSQPIDQCAECKALAPTTPAECMKCEAATPGFTEAANAFMKGGAA